MASVKILTDMERFFRLEICFHKILHATKYIYKYFLTFVRIIKSWHLERSMPGKYYRSPYKELKVKRKMFEWTPIYLPHDEAYTSFLRVFWQITSFRQTNM